jgi:heterodisulfide reductase subunit C/nitrate reductase gamma subunit
MFFSVTLYVSLAIFALGVLFKASGWFRQGLTEADRAIGPGPRIAGVMRAAGGSLSPAGIVAVLKALVLDALLLRRSFIRDRYRWAMHMLIFWGFMFLVVVHAMESVVSQALFPGYMSTLNPYLYLREIAGIMVLAGVGMAMYRRFVMPKPRLKTRSMDTATIALVALILVSGFLLKGAKIASQSEFTRMVEDYSILTDEKEIESLESLWVLEYGLISPRLKKPFDAAVIEEGRELNDMFCVSCHSPSQSAFVSYATSWLTYPVTANSDGKALVSFLWYIHILATFAGLAWLPFGKMFHALTSPVSLIAASASGRGSSPAATAVRRVMELDACTRCGACSERCSVGIAEEALHNSLILPSEKLSALRAVAAGQDLAPERRKALLEGLVVCTNCHRCTDVCPVGIDLQDIWTATREDLLRLGPAEPYVLSQLRLHDLLRARDGGADAANAPGDAARALVLEHFAEAATAEVVLARPEAAKRFFPDQAGFNACFSCRTCTSSCPIMDCFENPRQELGILPHQIIHATILGVPEIAASSRMLWACVGCYQCQEQCPQGVPVADVLYAHKHAALARLKTGENA